MTSKVERENGELKRITFSCDHVDGCDVRPDDTEITAAGGLTKMGWECFGGKHYCPAHRLTPAPAIQSIEAERLRRIEEEGFTAEHDDALAPGSLAAAAGCYLLFTDAFPNEGDPPPLWPWEAKWWKPKSYHRNLERAGAMTAAEIERIDRMEERKV